MLRAGLIRKLRRGIYTWMPLGLRVLRKVEAIVREEMNRAGALEVLMPADPARRAVAGDRALGEVRPGAAAHQGPRTSATSASARPHEEVITDIARKEIRSYRQLPVNFYQIQTKFRDEIRPRFGVMRAREFMMKDAYSFDADDDEPAARVPGDVRRLRAHLHAPRACKFRAVAADTGAIGGTGSHEFQVLADSGEDAIAYSPAVATTRRTSSWPRRSRRSAARAAAGGADGRRSPTPGQAHLRGRRRAPQDPARADGEVDRGDARAQDRARRCCCSCAATTC